MIALRITVLGTLTGMVLWSTTALAADPPSCATVRMSDPGWTDITTTTTTASLVLEALGYTPKVNTLSVAVTFQALQKGDIDVFLGNWMPAQADIVKKAVTDGPAEHVVTNLTGAKATLAVNGAAYDAGVKGFADLAAHGDRFGKTIYTIEPGSSANKQIQSIIDTNAFGLGGWKMLESSEAGMLTQVARAIKRNDWVVFLGWAPHPMNVTQKIGYLAGGDDFFGADYGAATVHTLSRGGFSKECANLGRLFKQMVFTVDMENEILTYILEDKMQPAAAVTQWLKAHPATVEPWLVGVETLDGKPGLPAVKKGVLGAKS